MKLTKSRLKEIIREEIQTLKKVNEMNVGDTVYIDKDKKTGNIRHIHSNQRKATVELDDGTEKIYSLRDLTIETVKGRYSVSVMQEVIHEVLNEEEYDYWRDYQAGVIDRATYDRLVKQFQQRHSGYQRGRARARQRGNPVYLDVKFREKDSLKQKHGKALRWDPEKKLWYYLLEPGDQLPKDLERRKK